MADAGVARRGRDPLSTKPGRDVLLALGRYRSLTSYQINRLLYANRSPTFVYEALAALRAAGYATDANWIARRATGAPRKLWCLTHRGGLALSREGVPDVSLPRHRARRSGTVLEHLHDLNDVLITCELLAARTPGVELLGFKHDDALRRQPTPVTLPDGRQSAVVPDGWVAYGFPPDGRVACFTVELDRGLEGRDQWSTKIRALVAFASGQPSPYERAFGYRTLTVLVVVRPAPMQRVKTPAGRLAELLAWTEAELEAQGKRSWGPFFRFTEHWTEEMAPHAFFGTPAWAAPFAAGRAPLLADSA